MEEQQPKPNFYFPRPIAEAGDRVSLLFGLSGMVRHGLIKDDGLELLKGNLHTARFRGAVDEIKHGLKKGESLSGLIGARPKVFGRFATAMCDNDISNGKALAAALNKSAKFEARHREMRDRLIDNLTYPTIILILLIYIAAASILMVVPIFTDLFMELGGALPAFLQFVVDGIIWWPLLFALILIVAVWLGAFNVKIRVPFISRIYDWLSDVMVADFLSVALAAGVGLNKAMEASSRVVKDPEKARALKKLGGKIGEGDSVLSSSFKWYLTAGYRRGDLSEACSEFARIQEQRIEMRVKNVNQALEAALVLILGIGTGIIVVGLLSGVNLLSYLMW